MSDDAKDALGFLDPASRPNSLGRIGHYEVLEVLGQGGFGIVYRAFDEVLQRVVAVKVLAPSMAATSPARKRFLREARHAAQTKHENVVQIYATEEQPLPFLVMEFIPGETLQQRLDRTGPLDVPEVLRIGRQIAEGLAAAHANGLIHRDIKPSNILIDSGAPAHVKITDFGLARAADDASISQSGVVAGTPMYMAPEQAKGDALDHRADLFSLGSVLYVMCSGRPPFRASGTLAVLKRVCEESPRPIREIIPEVPEWLCRVIEKLHAKDSADRFQTAKEVANLLEQHLAHIQHPDRVPLPDPVHGPVDKSSPPASPREFEQAGFLLFVLVGLALLTGLIVSTTEMLFPGCGLWLAASVCVVGVVVECVTRVASAIHPKRRGVLHPASGLMLLAGIPGVVFGLLLRQSERVGPELPLALGVGLIVLVALFLLSHFVVSQHPTQPLTGASKKVQSRYRRMAVSAALAAILTSAAVWSGSFLYRYIGNRGEVEIAPDSGWVSVIVYKDGVAVTDRLDVQNAPIIKLPPGKYKLEPKFAPGLTVEYWEVTTHKLFFGPSIKQQTRIWPFEFDVDRGERLTVRAVIRDDLRPPDSPTEKDSWVQLFNGKDLTGWRPHPLQPGNWRVEDGAMVGSGPEAISHLFSDRDDYENFHLRVEARVNFRGKTGLYFGNSGIYFRAAKDLVLLGRYPAGYEAQIFAGEATPLLPGRERNRTGSLYGLKPYEQIVPGADAGEWFTMEVIAAGPRITIKVNGKTTVDGFEDTTYRRGHLALQQVGAETVVQFRKIEIKELPAAKPTYTAQDRVDLAKLKGEWIARRAESDGRPVPLKEVGELEIRLADGVFELRQQGASVAVLTGTYRVEAANKQILLYPTGQTDPIRFGYRIEGDSLRLDLGHVGPVKQYAKANTTGYLKSLAIALHEYEENFGTMPPAGIADPKNKDGKPLLSWRVAILPFLEQENLYKEFKLDEPWDSEHNKKLIAKMPKAFAVPGIKTPEEGMTHYRVFVGPGTAFDPVAKGVRLLADFPDGLANTLMVVEAAEPVIWTKPDDLSFDPTKPLPKLGVHERATWVVTADGMTHSLPPEVPEATLRALATRNGGETVSVPSFTPPREKGEKGPPLYLHMGRKGSAPPGAVLLKYFDPAKDMAVPSRGDPKQIVSVEDGAWRIENAFDNTVSGNFRVALGTITDGIPEDGLLILRAKIKQKPRAENGGWGSLQLNAASPSFHGYNWPAHLQEYHGEITEWTEKEVRYPVEIIRKKNPPTVTIHVGLHGNGVLWVKDVELLHMPPAPKDAPNQATLQPLRDAISAKTQTLRTVNERFSGGKASPADVERAEDDLTEARIKLAEAEGDRPVLIWLLEDLVKRREAEWRLIIWRIETKDERVWALVPAEVRLAKAKARLSEVNPPPSGSIAPEPRSKQ